MSNYLLNVIASALAYFFSLLGIGYAFSKAGKIKAGITFAVIIAFSLYNGWALKLCEDRIPIDAVEEAWVRYAEYCREEHVSWSDLTFPEWLSIEAS